MSKKRALNNTKIKAKKVTEKALITIGSTIRIKGMNRHIVKAFKRDLWYVNEKYMNLFNRGIYIPPDVQPFIQHYYKEYNDYIVPAAYLEKLCKELNLVSQKYDVVDETHCSPGELNLLFSGEKRDYQTKAVKEILKHSCGVLEAKTGSGKTIIGIRVISERKVNTLILVHSKELLYQWKDRILDFTGEKVGLLGDGHKTIKPITVGIINTVSKMTSKLYNKFGMLICDETHRIVSPIWENTVNNLNPYYRLGLSATPFRREEESTKGIWALTGPIVHRIDPSVLSKVGAVLKPKIIRKSTSFMYDYRDDYAELIKQLTEDRTRNSLIINSVISDYKKYKEPLLIISDRVKHCEILLEMITSRHLEAKILSGKTPAPKRTEIVSDMKSGKLDIVFSTVSLISEGFDSKNLSALFLVTPIKYRGRAIQSIGRILRPKSKKVKPRLYDFRDMEVPVLTHSAFARDRTYKTQGW